jgi:exonuclease III
VVLVGLPLVMVMMVMGGSSETTGKCARGGSVVLAASSTTRLDDVQAANASAIVSEGVRMGVPQRAILIALTVASQESNFLNYANDGNGIDLAPDQRGVGASMDLPHDAVGSDHGSVGIFQQQWPWWGSLPELMDPATSARKFYQALLKTPSWQVMDIGAAGQAVQKSAFPKAYDDDVSRAAAILQSSSPASSARPAVYYGGSNAGECALGTFSGRVTYPVAQGGSYVDQANFGNAGSMWASTHTGTDFSASCGTPVLAATAGTVTVRTDQSWSGPWLVEISSGAGGVETWYAHMQRVDVRTGDRVRPGQPIGEVGTEGNSTGCHLHFEVRPGGGDPVDPTQWLSGNVGRKNNLGGPVIENVSAGGDDLPPDSTVLMTANIPFWLPDETVANRIHQLLRRKPDVLLLQEMGKRDVASIVARARGSWAAWQPPGSKNRDVIVWNADKFEVARRGTVLGVKTGRYTAWMPWMLLESDSGTLPVVNIHLPTNASKDPRMAAFYKVMTKRYLRLFSAMNQAGYPPVVGGDWNHPLHEAREPWSPVPQLRRVGLTTNWQHGRPCTGTSANNGRIDGFAYNPDYLRVVGQGCLDRGPSDHRPVWIAVTPVG